MTSIDALLYTDREGDATSVADLIDDGLEGGYEDRIPALRQLCVDGPPDHRVEACEVLVAWSDPVGLEALARWADAGERLDWAHMADCLDTGKYTTTPAVLGSRATAARALLRLAGRVPFEQRLSLALLGDRELNTRVTDELRAAIERCLVRIERRDRVDFDLTTETAELLVPLARSDDDAAAAFAERLMKADKRNVNMLRHLATAMGEGDGPRTRDVLERLSGHKDKLVRTSADFAFRSRFT